MTHQYFQVGEEVTLMPPSRPDLKGVRVTIREIFESGPSVAKDRLHPDGTIMTYSNVRGYRMEEIIEGQTQRGTICEQTFKQSSLRKIGDTDGTSWEDMMSKLTDGVTV